MSTKFSLPATLGAALKWKPSFAYKDAGVRRPGEIERIWKDVLSMERADYGKQIVQTMSGQLTTEYGCRLSQTNIFTAEHIELLKLEDSGIRVAEYLTELPPRPLLEAKLNEAIRLAREQIAARDVHQMEDRE